jgi:hypothetical protein
VDVATMKGSRMREVGVPVTTLWAAGRVTDD